MRRNWSLVVAACVGFGWFLVGARSAYPAVPDPALSAEIAVDQAVSVGPEGSPSPAPLVAASSSGFLATWIGPSLSSNPVVQAARLDTSGTPLDSTAIGIFKYPDEETGAVAVASDGTDYFVVFNRVPAQIAAGTPTELCGVRVRASDGALLDPAPIVLSNQYVLSFAVTYAGGAYVVAWSDETPAPVHWEIRTQRVQAGALLDPLNGALVGTSTSQPNPDVAAGVDQAFVVWAGSGVREQVSTGAVLDATPIAFAGLAAGTSPHAAFDGTNYFMTWNDGSTVWGARVRASDGTPLDPDDTFNQIPGSKKIVTGIESSPNSAAWVSAADGQLAVSYLVYSPPPAYVIASVAVDPTTAAVVGSPLELTTDAALDFGVAFGPTTAEVVSESYNATTLAVAGVTAANGPHTGGQITSITSRLAALDRAGNSVVVTSAASDGADYLVAWDDATTALASAAARVSASTLTSLDPSGIALTNSNSYNASVASSGNEYLAAWPSGASVMAVRIAKDGTLGTPFTVGTSPSSTPPVETIVCFDGVNYFVAWRTTAVIYGARVDGSTLALVDTTPVVVASPAGLGGPLGIAVDKPADMTRRTILVAFTTTGSFMHIGAARVRAELAAPVDATAPLAIRDFGSTTYYGGLGVTSDGTNFLVAWGEQRESGGSIGAYATRVVPLDGTILDADAESNPGVLLVGGTLERFLGVLWDGVSYAVAWSAPTSSRALYPTAFGLMLTRFTSSLAPVDLNVPPGLLVEAEARSATLASAGGGALLVGYSAFALPAGELGWRARARILTDDGVSVAVPDAGSSDAAGPDAAVDAGSAGNDAGSAPDGSLDATTGAEAGTGVEAGLASDASSLDASRADASVAEAGTSEAGLPGAGDASRGDLGDASLGAGDASAGGADASLAADTTASQGCSCRLAPSSTPSTAAGGMSIAALLLLRRRRRAARRGGWKSAPSGADGSPS